MAHVAKRPRLHGPKNPTLTLPATTPKLRNLQIEHENSLRQSAQRLKTSWEDICRRYGRDFDGRADEIDLRTGELVIDNGHLRGLEEDLENTWGGGDDDEEGDDAGSATSSLEMELLARRPMLARDEMGGPMLRDDEAEEIDVDEDLDRDAIDDLFDELELTTGLTGKDKRRREKDQKILEAQESVQKEQNAQDSMPSPASSESAEQDEDEDEDVMSTELPPVKQHGINAETAASPDELPPDDIVLEYVSKLGRQRLLALVQTLQSTEQRVEMEDPAIVAQLTPISDCGKPLSDQLGEAVEKLAASKEPIPESTSEEDVLESEQVAESERNGGGGLKPSRGSELSAALELPAGTVQCSEDGLDYGVAVLPLMISEVALDNNLVKATTEAVTCNISTLVEREREFIVEIGSEPEHKPKPALEPEPEFEPELESEPQPQPQPQSQLEPGLEPEPELESELTAQLIHNQILLEEPRKEPVTDSNTAVDRELLGESQPPTMDIQEPDPNFHYGDIDDLSTIIVPKAQVPVTPKNRHYGIKSSSSLRKAISSRKQSRRRLSEVGTPKRVRTPLSSRRKEPRTVPSKLQSEAFHATPRASPPKSAGPMNFWSALPGDPFFDPRWQDSHPDGEPAFEEFERRRILLEEHAVDGAKQKKKASDGLMVLDSSPVKKKTRTKTNSQATPKIKKLKVTKEPRTPTSKRAKYEDEVERKLHTPRSGKFLEYVKQKAAKERDGAEKEIAVEGLPDGTDGNTGAEPRADATIATPTRRMRYDYGLSDSEEEDLLPINSQDLQISSTQTQKRTRGRPRKALVPLIAPDPPAPSPKRLRSMGSSAVDPLTKCGNAGYRCGKTLCFKCTDE
ncbi:hypothetical protein TWF970_006093 [Orbilia oligospora]|uniref:Uncharacterized protein n=1 Tax=Orbilia oligospora TaxID=2813651 RepID=A0A7C8V570_ORBOL|nr:hypothetical protein TWF970_006093 [Orbilia oligospora]